MKWLDRLALCMPAVAAAEKGVAASMTRFGMSFHNALGAESDAAASLKPHEIVHVTRCVKQLLTEPAA